MGGFHAGWYLIYTLPRQEKKVIQELLKRDICSLAPSVNVQRQWHDRKKTIQTFLFPSYIFVELITSAQYFAINSIPGFCKFIKVGNQLARIPDNIIDSLKLILVGANLEVLKDKFIKGQKVTFQKGIFAGLKGEVLQYNARQKVLLRLDVLESQVLVDCPSGNLEICNELN